MHRKTHRETNEGQWECPSCKRKVHEPDNLPPLTDIDAWRGICAQHAPDCAWCHAYAPKAIWEGARSGAVVPPS
ncbi:MAG TPA: hypothetical protein VFB38_14225 [Chthonomonadaceae bacterium]|nr:hypothetical protein [Chthonomonadaceae bacterium]